MQLPGVANRIAALVTTSLALATPSRAQMVNVDVASVSAAHSLFGERLVGAAVMLRQPVAGGRLTARLGAERVTGTADRVGRPCSGLINPDACPMQPLRDDGRISSLIAGVGVRVFGHSRAVVDLTADLSLATLDADTRGRVTNQMVSANASAWGGMLGAEARWKPFAHLPVGLGVSVSAGRLTPIDVPLVADGYQPFFEAFGVRALRLGLSWWPAMS